MIQYWFVMVQKLAMMTDRELAKCVKIPEEVRGHPKTIN